MIIKKILTEIRGNGTALDMKYWRERICDAVFYFFSVFGFFVYIPSVILSIREEIYSVALADTLVYLLCIFMTVNRRISYLVRAVTGIFLFYLLGLVLIITMGTTGAGSIWLFSTTVIAALLLGNKAAAISLILNSITQMAFYFLILTGVFNWKDALAVPHEAWLIKAVNFIILNSVIVIMNAVFLRGFNSFLAGTMETRNASIIGLAKLAEYRDTDTGEHLKRIGDYSVLLAEELALTGKYSDYITDDYIKDLRLSSILHDIGKVGINDSILLKPGPLSKEEFSSIKRHPEIGASVIDEIEKNISGRSLYDLAGEIALFHHEKWDGSGYPEGRKGTEIPLSARIVALADVYDAVTSRRPYKESFTHENAVDIISEGRGTHFDPDVVDAFLLAASRFKKKEIKDIDKSSIISQPMEVCP